MNGGILCRSEAVASVTGKVFMQIPLCKTSYKIGKSILEQQAAASNPSVQLSFKYFFIINLDLAFFNN